MSIPRLIYPIIFVTLSFSATLTLAQTGNEPAAASARQEAIADKNATIDTQNTEKAKIAELKQTMLDMTELTHVQKIVYADEKGAVLESDEFFKRVSEGQSFSIRKIVVGDIVTSATLTLNSETQTRAPQVITYNINPGDAFPAFQKKDLAGHGMSNKQLLGRYSLVNFYFAQCPPCVKEIPVLNALAGNYADMNFVAITFDSNAVARTFASEKKFNWRVLADDKAFISKLGVKAYPAFMVLDPKGKVIAIATGSQIGNSDGSVESWMKRMITAAGPQRPDAAVN